MLWTKAAHFIIMTSRQLETEFLNMENDLSNFIKRQRQSINEDKIELEKESPIQSSLTSPNNASKRLQAKDGKIKQVSTNTRFAIVQPERNIICPQRNRESSIRDSNYGLLLNFGRSEDKQQKLKEERQREYKQYLEDQQTRTFGRLENDNHVERHPAPQLQDKEDFRLNLKREYNELLKQKKKDEKAYRVQFEEPDTEVKTKKKVIEFDSDDELLFEFVKRAQQAKRQKSADSASRGKSKFKKAAVFEGRANSVPPAVPAIFGGASQSSHIKEKQKQYKKELEDQIKEKELWKAKEKLKRLGRISSDVDISEIQIPENTKNKWALPTTKMKEVLPEKVEQSAQVSNHGQPDSSFNTMNPYTMYMNQNALGGTPMLNPMINNVPIGWNNYSMMPNPGFIPPMMGFSNMSAGVEGMNMGRSQWNYENRNPKSRSRPISVENSSNKSAKPDTDNIPKRSNVQPPGGKSRGLFDDSSSKDELLNKRAQQLVYKDELKKQMEEKKKKDMESKAERERYERKLEAEIASYDPWGKGGGGAPMRNQDGKIMADLRHLRQPEYPTEPSLNTAASIEEPSPMMRAYEQSQNETTTLRNTTEVHINNNVSPSYGRGAALKELQGLNSLSPRDKADKDDYKIFLQKQVEEKRKKEEELKEKARLEEEKENERIAEQQRKMKEEFEKEKQKQRSKEEEIRKKNEELRLIAEQKRYEEERKMKQIVEEQDSDLRKQAEMKLIHKESEQVHVDLPRSDSPPVPALAKEKKRRIKDKRTSSGGVSSRTTDGESDVYLKTIRDSLKEDEQQKKKEQINQEQQEDLIRQLSAMRLQLQKQEHKVQTELEKNKEKYSEIASVKEPKGYAKPHIKDVFEKVNRKSAGKTRQPIKVQSENMQVYASDFGQKDFDSQQQECMRQQEIRLKALRQNVERKDFRQNIKSPLQTTHGSRQSLLDSDSKFLSITSNHEIYPRKTSADTNGSRIADQESNEIFEDFFGRLKDSDNASISTNRIEDIAQRNEERLRRFGVKEGNVTEEQADDIVRDFMKNDRSKPNC